MNKKKIIILSSVSILLIIIAVVIIVVFTGGDKDNTNNNNNIDNTTSNNITESIKETSSTESENITEENETETSTVVEKETESTSEIETTEEVKTEETTTNNQEQPTETPTTGNNQQQTLDIKEAYKLTPVGSYTEFEMELDDALKEVLQNTRVVRRTYENGAVRDYMIIDGEEVVLDNPYGVVSDDYKADPNAGAHVSSGEKPTQPQKQEVLYKGIFPPRSSYSTNEEWVAAVNEISNQHTTYIGGFGTYFSSEADAHLFNELHVGEFTGDSDFINMTTEEWLKWCEENGFSVN